MAFERDAFRHHIWATLRVLDACEVLSDEQLTMSTTGTYGGILETLRHLVHSDTWYLFGISGGALGRGRVEPSTMGIAELREIVAEDADGWEELLDGVMNADDEIVTTRSDGDRLHATLGIRLAQVVHHGTDHRSQVCTALTVLGIEPPAIDVWDYGESVRRVRIEPT